MEKLILLVSIFSVLMVMSRKDGGWRYLESLDCNEVNGGAKSGEKSNNVDLATCMDACKRANSHGEPGCEMVTRKKKDGTGPGFCENKYEINLAKCETSSENDIYFRYSEIQDLFCPAPTTNTQDRVNEIIIKDIPTPKHCSGECINNTNCYFWTWFNKDDVHNSLTCILMSSYGSTVSDVNAVTADRRCHIIYSFCYQKDTDYPGNDVDPDHTKQTKSPYECQALCQQTDDCEYFSWNPPFCRLKNEHSGLGGPNGTKYLKGVFSGRRECSIGGCLPEEFDCGFSWFQCIHMNMKCDGKPDCQSGNDEREFNCNGR